MKKTTIASIITVATIAGGVVALLVVPRGSKPPIDLPQGKAVSTVEQRNWWVIAASGGSVAVSVGDVTRGQVTVGVHFYPEIRDTWVRRLARLLWGAQRQPIPVVLLTETSMRPSDKAEFELKGHRYALTLRKLRNVLIGTDTVTFEIAPATADADPAKTKRIIERLIQAVEQADVAFIRNGTQYSAPEAADHLRRKWAAASETIRTPEQFIDEIATRSSASGTPYTIKLKGGTVVTSDKWLGARLNEILDIRAQEQPGGK